jgi:hypothetical protein
LVLPETERENELMGDARDSFIDKGRETMRDAVAKVTDVAEGAQPAATAVLGGEPGQPENAAQKHSAPTAKQTAHQERAPVVHSAPARARLAMPARGAWVALAAAVRPRIRPT